MYYEDKDGWVDFDADSLCAMNDIRRALTVKKPKTSVAQDRVEVVTYGHSRTYKNVRQALREENLPDGMYQQVINGLRTDGTANVSQRGREYTFTALVPFAPMPEKPKSEHKPKQITYVPQKGRAAQFSEEEYQAALAIYESGEAARQP